MLINLIDNAIEAMGRRGLIVIETAATRAAGWCASSSPMTGRAFRRRSEKLFLPQFSTVSAAAASRLAIVRRIVAEHGGSVDVADNTPRGTRFTIELPQ